MKTLRRKLVKLFNMLRIPFLALKYRSFTMISRKRFMSNLNLCNKFRYVDGSVVECGVWRGGMSAALAELLGPRREYLLFDSFEGLPPAKPIDGKKAAVWQSNKAGKTYFDNCAADMDFAKKAMTRSKVPRYRIIKGWFKDTLPAFDHHGPIAILRLDGDWYESTMECLTFLYPRVKTGGVIILDDYITWEGCSKAVHDYLSKHKLGDRIERTRAGVYYFTKR